MSAVLELIEESNCNETESLKINIADIENLKGTLLESELMSKHTSWRVGGPADYFFKPADVEDLANFLTQVPADMPLHWLGLGSNLLVRDGGIRGVVILTSGLLNHIEFLGDGLFRAEAGVACAKLARQVARMNFAECEFLAGIPGTIGGALAMNAGAFGGETWEKVEAVETLDRQGRQHLRRPDEYQIAYRQVSGPANEWFIAGHFRFNAGNGEETLSRIKELLAKRNASQPTNQPSCGSVFRNPEGDFAARLIEQCGLKGTCIGGACVSQKHANFIVNTGNATAADIESLIELVARTVKDQQGVDLIREAHIMGEKE